MKEGKATYCLPKAYQEEARIFVEQNDKIISCFGIHSGQNGINRRIGIKGLKNAVVRFYPPANFSANSFKAFLNTGYPYKTGQIEGKKEDKYSGDYYVFEDITGQLIVAW